MHIGSRRWGARALILIFVIGVMVFSACGFERRISFSGKTMGTVYHISVIAPALSSKARLQEKIETRMAEINNRLSTYISTSEISRFNDLAVAGQPFAVSADFMAVLRVGTKVYTLTGGAWDATVWPLVKLWGFHLPKPRTSLPEQKKIEAALACVGFSNMQLLSEGSIAKKKACVSLDLGSIAKGYGVDQIAELLKKQGLTNFIVEIGGEVLASGVKENGAEWNIGINLPEAYAAVDQVRRTLVLTNRAVATSGDYRNFFTINGNKYCHVLDPRTGYPVKTGVISASVVAEECTFADGLATALMVMTPQEGVALVNSLENTECLITVREENGQLRDYYSQYFQ